MIEFVIFFFFAAIAVIFALVVILHRNAVVGALSLVACFFALAVMYVLLALSVIIALIGKDNVPRLNLLFLDATAEEAARALLRQNAIYE